MGAKKEAQSLVAQTGEKLTRVALITGGPDIQPTQAMPNDPFESMYAKNQVIEPLLPLGALVQLPLISSTLASCVDAYEVNIEGHGYHFECLITDKKELDRLKDKPSKEGELSIDDELELVEETFDYFNPKESLTSVRRKLRKDREYTASCYLECVRNRAGMFAGGWPLPSHEMRLLPLDDKPTVITTRRLKKDWTWKEVREEVYFRRFVQIRGSRKVYFKEFGDPRNVSARTGEYLPNSSRADLATEVIHQCNYSPATPYGLPRFAGAMLAVLGSNEAEKVNYRLFLSNMIPAMWLFAMGAPLDVEKIREQIRAMRGKPDTMFKILMVEAIAQGTGDGAIEKPGIPRLDVKPMTQFQTKDMLHQQYLKSNEEAIAAAFRLPAIFRGRSTDYTRATADTARRVSEEQVFSPERNETDFMINRLILPNMGIRYWKFVSNKPELQDFEEQARILNYLGQHGGVNPNMLVKFYNRAFNDSIPEIAEPWGNQPLPITLEELRAQGFMGGAGGFTLTEKTKDSAAKGMTKLFLDTLLHIRENSQKEHAA